MTTYLYLNAREKKKKLVYRCLAIFAERITWPKARIMRMTRIDYETSGASDLSAVRPLVIFAYFILLTRETCIWYTILGEIALEVERESQRYIVYSNLGPPRLGKSIKFISSPSIDRYIDVSISRLNARFISMKVRSEGNHVSTGYLIKGTGSR